MKYFVFLSLIFILAGCEPQSKPVMVEAPQSNATEVNMPSPGSSSPVFNHTALVVRDFEKSARFYKDVIGLDTISNPFNDGRHAWFSIGVKSALHIIGGATATSEHPRDNHICFSVKSVDEFIENLVKQGVAFEDAKGKPSTITIRPDGVKQIYFKDPDGYWIEINDAKG